MGVASSLAARLLALSDELADQGLALRFIKLFCIGCGFALAHWLRFCIGSSFV
jgi:hypothetical protein